MDDINTNININSNINIINLNIHNINIGIDKINYKNYIIRYKLIIYKRISYKEKCEQRGRDAMKKVISRCPICNEELTVVRLKCDSCDTVIENNFRLSKFDYLSDEELYFTETFIRCRGNIKEVEKALGISYPTVRARLDTVIKKFGYEAGPDEQAVKREEVLKALENGEITAEQAIAQLK